MRGFIVFSLFFICFSAPAQVVCKDPNSAGGDEVAEAGSSPALCRTNVTDAPQGTADREVNSAQHRNNLVAKTPASGDGDTEGEESPPAKGGGGSTEGSIQ